MARASLKGRTSDDLAKDLEGFIQGKIKAKPKIGKVAMEKETHKMLNTRVEKTLIKQMKQYCLDNDMTIQEFIDEAIRGKVNK